MSDLSFALHRQRAEPALQSGNSPNPRAVPYNHIHDIDLNAAPDRGGDPDRRPPKQAPAATLFRSHLTLLVACAQTGWPVGRYHDFEKTHWGKNDKGQTSVMRIDLNPGVRFNTGLSVDTEKLDEVPHRAPRLLHSRHAG
jgi:hypothetical protein